MILLLPKYRNVFYASFRKFAQTMIKIQQTPPLKQKKAIIEYYYNQSSKIDQSSIINILNFIRDKPKTGLADKTITNFMLSKFFQQQGLEEVGLNFQELVDSLQDVEEQSQQPTKEQGQLTQSVNLQQVQEFLTNLKTTQGKGSAKKKLQMLSDLTDNMKVVQIRVLLRILAKKLRIGLTDKSLQFKIKQELEKIKQQNPLSTSNLKSTTISFQPMLSKPLKSLQQVHSFCKSKGEQSLIADLKYDGQRTLITYQKGKGIELMSRRKKAQTEIYKNLSAKLQKQLEKVPYLENIKIDGQILCVSDKQQPLPMQLLLTKRGKQIQQEQTNKVLVYGFDVLEYNGQSLLNKPLSDRRKFVPVTDHIRMAQFITFKYPDGAQQLLSYYKQALERRYEGLIIKGENDLYFTNGTRRYWGKFKKGCKIQSMDTGKIDLDLVVMGADFGAGKKSKVFAGFLMGTYHKGNLHPVSRLGSGFTNEELQKFTELFQKSKVDTLPIQYSMPKNLKMDVYFKPQYVFKVACQDLTRSPLFGLGYVQNQGGLSLRFPVFEGIRDDKDPKSCQSDQIFLVNIDN